MRPETGTTSPDVAPAVEVRISELRPPMRYAVTGQGDQVSVGRSPAEGATNLDAVPLVEFRGDAKAAAAVLRAVADKLDPPLRVTRSGGPS